MPLKGREWVYSDNIVVCNLSNLFKGNQLHAHVEYISFSSLVKQTCFSSSDQQNSHLQGCINIFNEHLQYDHLLAIMNINKGGSHNQLY